MTIDVEMVEGPHDGRTYTFIDIERDTVRILSVSLDGTHFYEPAFYCGRFCLLYAPIEQEQA